jgi:hypothetical protein
VAETRRLKRLGAAVDEFLDKLEDERTTAGTAWRAQASRLSRDRLSSIPPGRVP